jgi:hypothetical protein
MNKLKDLEHRIPEQYLTLYFSWVNGKFFTLLTFHKFLYLHPIGGGHLQKYKADLVKALDDAWEQKRLHLQSLRWH